ncbi:nucleoporin GLE1 [Culex quinquefasciatus]|uniref:mRNA export factor GLE1 n=1 Tax=Culex quinquefasciatus TaxID=7176 RepID=B0X4P3_CULQU|nr:nucleoporin GLE1 [Culex quinquefasciatus]|eukprot:XP_001864615.1 nucleoporin GLE1 [Culex quinquefasciatus]
MDKFTLDMDELLSDMQSLQVSALSRAAKISPLVQGRTLGPDCAPFAYSTTDADSENDPNLSNVSSSEPDSEPPPERYVPNLKVTIGRSQEGTRKVDIGELGALVSFRMFEQERERERRKEVARVLEERQVRVREADRLREEQHRERLKKVAEEKERRAREVEVKLLEAIREQERAAKEFEERNNAEIEAENRRLAEVSEQLRRKDEEMKRKQAMFEAIRTHQGNFRKMTDVFTKTLQAKAEYLANFGAQKKSVQTVVKAFEQLLHGVNVSREVTQQDVDRAVDYCKQMEQINAEVGEILNRIQQEVADRQKKEQEQAEAQKQQQQKQEAPPEVAPPVPQDTPDTTAPKAAPPPNPLAAFVSQESLAFYTEIKSFYEQHQAAVKTLLDDASMKTYRFSCQKAINTPVNAISAVSREHFLDKFTKLDALLSGQQVRVGDQPVSINAHPLGEPTAPCCSPRSSSAKRTRPSPATNSRPSPSPPSSVSPTSSPTTSPQLAGQSQEDYLKAIGYRFSSEGILEKQDQYLKRMTGLARLYGAVIVTNLRRGESAPHPHGLECGWKWLCNILNLAPLPDICATLITEFLQTAGGLLWTHYGRQFVKVMRVMHEQYLPELNKVDEGGPKSRLEGLVAKITAEGRIERPEGMMAADFW